MIPVIDARLCVWGKRQFSDERRGRGYSPVCPMFFGSGSARGQSAPPLGVAMTDRESCEDIGAAVVRLSVEHRRIVAETYVIGGHRADVARRMGIARQRYYEQLHAIHCDIQRSLHAMAIGA